MEEKVTSPGERGERRGKREGEGGREREREGERERRGRCMWHVVFTLNMPTRHGIPDKPVRSLESAHSIL